MKRDQVKILDRSNAFSDQIQVFYYGGRKLDNKISDQGTYFACLIY